MQRGGYHEDETTSLNIIDIFVIISDGETGMVSKNAEKVFPNHCSDEEPSGSIDQIEIYGYFVGERKSARCWPQPTAALPV